MKRTHRISARCFVPLPGIAHAQAVLPGQPAQADPPASVDAPRRQLLYGGETIRRGMVWRADAQRNQWVQAEVNSCEFCGKPMSWKKAAFDSKALPLWLVAVGLAVADTEYTLSRPCIQDGTCTEWNPLLGTSRAQQYGVRMPVLAVAWFATSWLRKGRREEEYRRHEALVHIADDLHEYARGGPGG